jgi:hypothetical protein
LSTLNCLPIVYRNNTQKAMVRAVLLHHPTFPARRVHGFDGFFVSASNSDGTVACVGDSLLVRHPERRRFDRVYRRQAGNLRPCLCA